MNKIPKVLSHIYGRTTSVKQQNGHRVPMIRCPETGELYECDPMPDRSLPIALRPQKQQQDKEPAKQRRARIGTEERNARITEMYQSGSRVQDIMAELRISNQIIAHVLDTNGIQRRDVRTRTKALLNPCN